MTAIPLPFGFVAPRERGVSETAKSWTLLQAQGEGSSVTIDNRRTDLTNALWMAYREAAFDNWNDEGAKAVSPEALEYAHAFAAALPTTLPLPEVSAIPDGELMFEWDSGPRRVFAVAIGRDGTMNYAGYFGRASVLKGMEPFFDEIPAIVFEGINRAAVRE